MQANKILPPCTNEYAKDQEEEEGEENITFLVECYEKLLTTMSNYLLNNMLV